MIGDVPTSSWQTKRLGALLKHVIDFRGRTPKKLGMDWGDGTVPALSANNVKMGQVDLSEPTFYGSEALYTRWMTNGETRQGDVLMTMEAPLGNVAQVPNAGRYILSQRVVLLRFDDDELTNTFAAHQMRGESFQRTLERWSTGTTATGIQRARLVCVPMAVPLLPEQRQIAAILDTLDDAIRKTEQIIAKLKQVKQGLLHDLLTRGIDDNGELRDPERHPEQFKDSALGRIPKEWKCSKLGAEFTLQRGFDITVAEQQPGPYPVVSSSGITSYHNRAMVNGAGVVTGRKGNLGAVYYIDGPHWPHDTSLWVKDFHGNEPRFAAISLAALRLERFDAATSVPTLNRNFVHPLPIAIPSRSEQLEVVKIVASFDSRIAGDLSQVGKLHFLKQGLMKDLLTGRVRVTKLLEQPPQ